MVIGVKLKPNIRGSNRFERNFFYNNFYFQNQNNKNKSFFLFLQASSLNILDAGFRPDFRKENNSSSSSSIKLEYFKRRLRAGFYNRVQASSLNISNVGFGLVLQQS